jgi:hypothetical protein
MTNSECMDTFSQKMHCSLQKHSAVERGGCGERTKIMGKTISNKLHRIKTEICANFGRVYLFQCEALAYQPFTEVLE